MLQRQGYDIVAATNGEQGLVKALEEKPDLILLDVMMPDMDGYEVTRRLRKDPATLATPILMFTAKTQLDDKVTGFEVGADDYLTKPTHPSELQAHVRTLLARSEKNDHAELDRAGQEHHGFVVGVLASRGGLGVSSVAANLAAALSSRAQCDVTLAELTPGLGTLGMDLGLTGDKELNNLLSGDAIEITREKARAALTPHVSGIQLLAASENPRDIHLTSRVANYEALVSRLSTLSRFIILDLGVGLPPFVQHILPMCMERVVVVEGMPNSIHQSRVLIDEIAAIGIDRKTVTAVLNNRVRSETQMPWTQVQEKLGHSIAITLTPAPELFYQAARMQTPAVVCQPTNVTAQQFFKLADLMLEREKAR
jgi:CheY-like chemotaxis protein/MinD-like ATPase involved in chromosome partitioning or flagellar assembly